jgi:hypothetical protein
LSAKAKGLAIKTKGKPRGKPFVKGDPRIQPQWKPGQSGNPSGRPKNQAESHAYIAARIREEYLEQLVTALALHAIKGSPTHIVEALNRVAGKVTDKTELSGQEGGPIVVTQQSFAEEVRRIHRLSQEKKEKSK